MRTSTPHAPPAAPAAAETLPDVIVAEHGGFIPEGVEYDVRNGRLLTGALSEGAVFRIHADGRVEDDELVSSVGTGWWPTPTARSSRAGESVRPSLPAR